MNPMFEEAGDVVDFTRMMLDLEDADMQVEVNVDIPDGDELLEDENADQMAEVVTKVMAVVNEELPGLYRLRRKAQRMHVGETLLAYGFPLWAARLIAYLCPLWFLPDMRMVAKLDVAVSSLPDFTDGEKGEEA